MTKPGTIGYLLYGEIQSSQSISIKMGKFGLKNVKKLFNFCHVLLNTWSKFPI